MIEEGMKIDLILFCDTGLEFPEMYEHIRKVEKYIGRKITILKPEKDFMWWATEYSFKSKTGSEIKGKGYPSRMIRWCNQKFKRDVCNKYLNELRKKYDVIIYAGIAFDEPSRVANLNYPLIYRWRMTEKACLQFCYERGFDWDGLYEIWDRVSCWCCPLQSLKSLRKLRKYRPNLWKKLKEIDAKLAHTIQPNFKFDRSLSDIERRFEVEDEFIAEGKKIGTKEFYATLRERGIKY
jgi:3'-phosphoadenosine 5'-phosphosulfate sulfotransferase (PAPS reductase)/FAD synthetase